MPQDGTWNDLARALTSESPDIVVVISPEGVVLHVSAAGEAFIGHPAAELIGQSVLPWIHPDDLDLAIDVHRAAVRGAPRGLVMYRVRAGTQGYRWVEVSKQPLRDPASGTVPAVLEIARDVTERVTVAQRLRDSEARLKMAQRISRVGSWEIDLAANTLIWSEEMFRLLGLAPADTAPPRDVVQRMIHADDREAVAAVLARVSDGEPGAEEAYYLRVQRPDGVERVLSCLATKALDPERGPVLVGVSRDVTDEEALREAEQAGREALVRARDDAEAASRAKSMFLANMSHELRTPLNAIIGYAELVGEEADDVGASCLTPDLAKIRTAGKHLLSLINDVLDLAKIEAGALELEHEDVAVSELTEGALAIVEPLARARGNHQEVCLATDLPRFWGDAGKVRQCLTNLLGNAHKFTRDGTVALNVTVERRGEADWLRFEVADTGIGMSAADQARVFQEFVQAEDGATRRFGGTGLGLTLVRAFAHAMGGEVSLASTPGEGTCVTLRLPARRDLAPKG